LIKDLQDFGVDDELEINCGKVLSGFNVIKMNLVKKETLKTSFIPFEVRKYAPNMMVDYPQITL